MIEVVVENELDAHAWASRVAACGGHALHLPAIHLVYEEPSSLRPLTFRRGTDVVACAMAFDVSSRRLRWPLARHRTLHLPTAPAVAQEADVWEVWTALLDFAAQAGYERLAVDPSCSPWSASLDPLASHRTEAVVEFVLDLRDGVDAVLGRLHKTHRKNIRRAQRQLTIEEDHSRQALLDLRDMQLSSSERASERAEGFAVGQETFFERLHEHVYSTGLGHVAFAVHEGRRVAALAWVATAHRVQTVRSGSQPEGYESRAMYLLHDHLIRRIIGEGAVELNVGGVPAEASQSGHPQAGLYEFKNGFGGQAMTCYGLDVPVREWRR